MSMGRWMTSRALPLIATATVIVLVYLASTPRKHSIHQVQHESTLVIVYNRVLFGVKALKRRFFHCVSLNFYRKSWLSHRSIPKTGSTTVMNIVYKLAKRNSFRTVLLNVTKNQHTLSLQDQWLWARNLSSWTDYSTLYHGHIAYLNFDRLATTVQPLYIQLVRDPLERLISYYYFLRCGDDHRPHLVRAKAGDNRTFDQCVQENGAGCAPERLWLQVPFFCGHTTACWEPGSRWALEQAKGNLFNRYFLVGITEKLPQFMQLLEKTIPRLFDGANDIMSDGNEHIRRTICKQPPTEATIRRFQESQIWQMENHFYEIAKAHFESIWRRSDRVHSELHYDKIRPDDNHLRKQAPLHFEYNVSPR